MCTIMGTFYLITAANFVLNLPMHEPWEMKGLGDDTTEVWKYGEIVTNVPLPIGVMAGVMEECIPYSTEMALANLEEAQ